MKLLIFDATHPNLYHLIQESDFIKHELSKSKRKLNLFNKEKLTPKEIEEKESLQKSVDEKLLHIKNMESTSSSIRLTGKCKDVEVGDLLACQYFPHHADSNIKNTGVIIVKEVSHRDHKGVFKNPEDAVSFFEAYCEPYPMQLDDYNKMTEEKELEQA